MLSLRLIHVCCPGSEERGQRVTVVSTFHTCVTVLEVKNGDKSVVSTFHTRV